MRPSKRNCGTKHLFYNMIYLTTNIYYNFAKIAFSQLKNTFEKGQILST